MRLWSIHPKYLDTKGLVALWREALLARKVLEGKTKGYRHHPEALRFKYQKNPLPLINKYLSIVYKEGEKRGYKFNIKKLRPTRTTSKIKVSKDQIVFEQKRLLNKLKKRAPESYAKLKKIERFSLNPTFKY
jgi:hypothetical protein